MDDVRNYNPSEDEILIEPYLEPILPTFLAEIQGYADGIAAALSEGNYQEIRRLGHTIAGTSSYFGLELLINIGRTLESEADDQCDGNIEEITRALSHCLERIRAA